MARSEGVADRVAWRGEWQVGCDKNKLVDTKSVATSQSSCHLLFKESSLAIKGKNMSFMCSNQPQTALVNAHNKFGK